MAKAGSVEGTGQRRIRSIRALATGVVAALVCLLLVSTGASVAVRIYNASVAHTLASRWLPAQTKTMALESQYIDEETGERGYLLTGDHTFLAPYTSGERRAGRLEAELRRLLAPDATAAALLERVITAHRTWQQQSAAPEIALRDAGPIGQGQLDALARVGEQRFGALRSQLSLLSARTAALTADELGHISAAQVVADVVAAGTVALALAAAALAIPVTRRVLTRPLDDLLGQVQQVAGGDVRVPIEPHGSTELVAMGTAAERMRQSLIHRSDELVQAQDALTLQTERDRLAADLHDRTIQRVFALGLSLSSLAKRHPDQAAAIRPLIDETDRCIQELRAIVFNISHHGESSLRGGAESVVREAARVLGFPPHLEVRGPIEAATDEALTAEALTVLREALSNALRHARASRIDVLLSVDDGHLHVMVSDDGVGLTSGTGEAGNGEAGNGVRNMQARAARLGGTATVQNRADGGTTFEWRVPVGRPPQAADES